jgi:hypothetical protein
VTGAANSVDGVAGATGSTTWSVADAGQVEAQQILTV